MRGQGGTNPPDPGTRPGVPAGYLRDKALLGERRAASPGRGSGMMAGAWLSRRPGCCWGVSSPATWHREVPSSCSSRSRASIPAPRPLPVSWWRAAWQLPPRCPRGTGGHGTARDARDPPLCWELGPCHTPTPVAACAAGGAVPKHTLPRAKVAPPVQGSLEGTRCGRWHGVGTWVRGEQSRPPWAVAAAGAGGSPLLPGHPPACASAPAPLRPGPVTQ